MTQYDQFYKRSVAARRQIIKEDMTLNVPPLENVALSEFAADQMIENYIMTFQIPLGVATNFSINDRHYIIPMATEEPSVIAAASNGAKRVGNIQSSMTQREMIGQMVYANVSDPKQFEQFIRDNRDKILAIAAEHCVKMVKRGGGPRDVWAHTFQRDTTTFVSVYLSLDTCEAMGANVMNTVLEETNEWLQHEMSRSMHASIEGISLLNILSNYGERSVVSAKVEIPISTLHHDSATAVDIAQKIALASEYAQLDPMRATTHNKGIMNGITAIALATGNDTRAVEASAHAYASRSGQYKGLAQWHIRRQPDHHNITVSDMLCGDIAIPIQVATVGGTLSVHPVAKTALSLLNNPTAVELSEIMAAVGLAQNFAALRALVTDGIQKGHMGMQARAIALQLCANDSDIKELVHRLKQSGTITRDNAVTILNDMRETRQ